MVSLSALAKLHPDDPVRVRTAVDHLFEGLESDDATVRLAAAEGLNALPLDPEFVAPKLIKMLDDADPVVAYNLVETFASMGEPVALRAGTALSNEKLRGFAVQVLERLGPKAKIAVPHIVAGVFRSRRRIPPAAAVGRQTNRSGRCPGDRSTHWVA